MIHQLTTVNSQQSAGFRSNKFQQVLLLVYLIVWIIYAISPTYRPQWWLENYLVFAFFLVLISTYKKYQLSDLSYLFITIFLLLHVVGSHYGYSSVPVGLTFRDIFGLARNPYDRIVHFLFGFLFAYPIYEMLKRYSSQKGKWLYILPINFIISLIAVYEILEAVVAWTYPPEQYDPFVGLQGDIWDGYKDMLLVSSGGMISTSIIWFAKKLRKN